MEQPSMPERLAETGPRVSFRLFGLLLKAARPKQWGKNVLVFAAPATGGVLLEPALSWRAVLTFVSFCVMASGVYYVNDLVDRKVDRAHDVKRHRPIASGLLPARVAMPVAVLLLCSGVAMSWLVGPDVALVLAAYVGLTLAYSFLLRNLALLDLVAIAGGFMLRAIAGGVAVDVQLSSWFLMVTSFGSLFIAGGRRRAEFVKLGEQRALHRPILRQYSESYLRYIQYSCSTVAIAAYGLWALEGAPEVTIWSELSIVPFVIGVFRYGLLLDQGRGETPEDVVLRDPPLLAVGALWAMLMLLSVYTR